MAKALVFLLVSYFLLANLCFAKIYINEIMADPESGDEWVELYNVSDQEVSLSGWFLKDEKQPAKSLEELEKIPANGFSVYFSFSGWLNNGSETIYLYKGDIGNLEDQYSYSTSEKGKTISRTPDGSDIWQITQPSQGGPNLALVPTATPVSTITTTPTVTEAPKESDSATCKINKAVDENGNELSSVKIYIDGNYTHHYDDEILDFCDDCFCDDDKEVSCGFGEHEIKLVKNGYHDWAEVRKINSGDYFEIDPKLTKVVPTDIPTSAPTSSPAPSLSPTPKLTATPSAFLTLPAGSSSGQLYSLETNSTTEGEVLGEKKENIDSGSSRKGKAVAGMLVLVGGGAFVSAGYFSGKSNLKSDRIEE